MYRFFQDAQDVPCIIIYFQCVYLMTLLETLHGFLLNFLHFVMIEINDFQLNPNCSLTPLLGIPAHF